MKNKASSLVKNMLSVFSNIVKTKIMGVKSKADAMRVRLLVFSLLKSKKFSLESLSNKIQSLLEKKEDDDDDDIIVDEDQSKAIILYDAGAASKEYCNYDEDDDEDKYPDLTHSLFDEENGFEDDDQGGGSVIELVKSSKEQEGEDFKLEDEIDHVADLFIRRFKKHMRLEKLASFNRYQAMLGRSA